MHFILKILIYLNLCAGVRCVLEIPSLPCKFTDQQSFVNEKHQPDVKVIHREVQLQFVQKGDFPLNPRTATFLLTGVELDLRQYLEDVDPNQMECELHRHSTDGSHVQWPVQESQGYNYWFICTITHSRFAVTSFLRQPSDQPAPGRHDYHGWAAIKDGDVLTTIVAMIMKTQSPVVKAALGVQKTLDCQYVFDHQPTNFTVEWHSRCKGVRERRFSYNSLSRLTEGSGVELRALLSGNASYTIPPTKKCSEGTFVCSVSVNPVVANLDIVWTIEERPQIFLSVGPVLTVEAGERQRVFCKASGYYPREAEVIWYKYKASAEKHGGDAQLAEPLKRTHSSHKENSNGTYTWSAFFDFMPSLEDTGKHYTCNVFHQSLTVPLRMGFILRVEDPFRKMFYFLAFLSAVSLSGLLYLVRRMCKARRRSFQPLPY